MIMCRIFLALILGFSSALVFTPNAIADIVPYDRARAITPASTVDEVGLTFLRLAGIQPDFNQLALKASQVRRINPSELDSFLKNEAFRLQAKYTAFNPKKDILVLRLEVNLSFFKKEDKTSTLKINFPTKGLVYFPYYYADYPIAFIINDLESFQDMVLAEDETAIAAAHLGASGKATLMLEINPITADAKTPMKLDRMLQYPLLGNISYIGLLNAQAQHIWAWETPESAKRVHHTRNLGVLGIGSSVAPVIH